MNSLNRALAEWIHDCILPRHLPDVVLPPMHSLEEVQRFMTEQVGPWVEHAKQKGIAIGRLEGMTALLRRQLTRRFGPLPEWVEERLDAAEIAQLEEWADRILDATTLEGVFEDA